MDVSIKGNVIGFDTEKHVSLMRRIIEWVTGDNDIILDFFAGSGTTGDAIYQTNVERGSNRRFILTQIAAETPGREFATLAEMTRLRLKKASSELANKAQDNDLGFRTVRVDTSNMRDVYYRPDEVNKDDLFGQVDNIREGRTPDDLLFQVLVDWGVDLGLPISKETISKKSVYFVDGNVLAACFDSAITEELVKAIAGRKPMRVVFRDNGFASDVVKINVEQVFKLLSPSTEVKVI
jgi:adenine-specific DNA-methyltransferase